MLPSWLCSCNPVSSNIGPIGLGIVQRANAVRCHSGSRVSSWRQSRYSIRELRYDKSEPTETIGSGTTYLSKRLEDTYATRRDHLDDVRFPIDCHRVRGSPSDIWRSSATAVAVRCASSTRRTGARARARAVHANTTELTFSPSGNLLAIQNLMPSDPTGVVIVRTPDRSEAQRIGNNAGLFEWSSDSAGLWEMTRQGATEAFVVNSVNVPDGDVASSTNVDTNTYLPNAVTPDDRFMLSSSSANYAVVFLRTSDGSVAQRFSVAQRAWAGRVSPKNDVFTCVVCSDSDPCTLHVARIPAL
jgi:hypothetical protein